MFEHRCAYRHVNGDVEGFKGIGFSKESAKKDAHNQILRKCDQAMIPFNHKAIIEKGNQSQLSTMEFETVQLDWMTNARY